MSEEKPWFSEPNWETLEVDIIGTAPLIMTQWGGCKLPAENVEVDDEG